MDTITPDALVTRERDLVSDLDINRPPWKFRRGKRGGTASLASFVYALSMPEAPVALAMLRAYVDAVGLADTDRWSVSAMPSWAGATDLQRFATISSANIELFYVWFESITGEVSDWGIRIPAELGDRFPESDELWRGEAENGDMSVHGATLDVLLDLFAAPGARDALVATYERRQGPRRRDWHNPYLGALLGASIALVDEDAEPTTDEDVEFERRYIERVTKHRLHQAPLREAALRKYGESCMYCGLDIPQILEAAHVIPDSKGGAASTENIRILCANHHAAFDAGLIVLDRDRLAPAPGARQVPPGRPIALAIPEPMYSDESRSTDVDELEDHERYQWVVMDPKDLTPSHLGDTVLYDQANDSDLYVEGTLVGIYFSSESPSHPGSITYQLDIRPTDHDELVTVTLGYEGYVSRYVDTEDPEAW